MQSLDADDVLLPGALRVLLDALRPREVVFAFGGSAELLEDGTIHSTPYDSFRPGTVPPRAVESAWAPGAPPPIRGGTVLWRRVALLAHGGWAGLVGSEDSAVLMAAAAQHPVVYVGRDVMVQRCHLGQLSPSDAYRSAREVEWRFVRQRLDALRAMRLVEEDEDDARSG